MLLLFAYALMILDGIATLEVNEEAGELNPLFESLLNYDSVLFIYCKIGVSAALATGLAVLHKVRPRAGQVATILAVVVYGLVAYLHLEVYRALNGYTPFLPPVVNFLEGALSSPPSLQSPLELVL